MCFVVHCCINNDWCKLFCTIDDVKIKFFLFQKTHPLNERIANGKDASGNFLFACNIFVVNLVRPRIGGGTIISNRHVLTTASVVAGFVYYFAFR